MILEGQEYIENGYVLEYPKLYKTISLKVLADYQSVTRKCPLVLRTVEDFESFAKFLEIDLTKYSLENFIEELKKEFEYTNKNKEAHEPAPLTKKALNLIKRTIPKMYAQLSYYTIPIEVENLSFKMVRILLEEHANIMKEVNKKQKKKHK